MDDKRLKFEKEDSEQKEETLGWDGIPTIMSVN